MKVLLQEGLAVVFGFGLCLLILRLFLSGQCRLIVNVDDLRVFDPNRTREFLRDPHSELPYWEKVLKVFFFFFFFFWWELNAG